MTDDQLSDSAAIIAYQDVTLAELRSLFDQMDFDLGDILEREARITDALDSVDSEFDAARARLAAMGITAPAAVRQKDDAAVVAEHAPRRARYDVPLVPVEADFDRLVNLAEARLDQLGIDLTKDPLQQVLPDSEIARSLRAYSDEHGDISWDKADWGVVIGAGLLATLLDIVLVRIPKDTTFLANEYKGSPVTKWLKDSDRADKIQQSFKKHEKRAKVSWDANTTKATGGQVSGMRPGTHRLQSLGHDPVLGFLVGVADTMRGTGTYIDKAGKLIQVATDYDPVGLIEALITQVRHLLSDVATPAGLQPPLFTMLQLGQIQSPFALGPSGIKVPWTDVARYMYTNGYDLRHFFTMGITPGVVEMSIRGYWYLNSFTTDGTKAQRKLESAKLKSMLLLGHGIATSGTLLKTGLFYGMNPLALNYSQILAMAPATIAWFNEAVARDRRINQALEKEWRALLTDSTGQSRAFDSPPPEPAPDPGGE